MILLHRRPAGATFPTEESAHGDCPLSHRIHRLVRTQHRSLQEDASLNGLGVTD